ncbi:hypothetical protein DCC79_03875 [bacterium]|nr:hypothetical protein [Chloroflexi bacterium CFX6]RIL11723.1 MAG: hypothetical protein DCC79_03875 [bacterium]
MSISQPATQPAGPGIPIATAPPDAGPRRGFDQRYLAPMLITLILVAGNWTTGMLESPWKTGLAIASAIGTEALLSRLTRGTWPHMASAYITGISVGILVRSPFFWPYALCAIISILSKYVLQAGGRHVWNPSNFGIVMMLIFAHPTVATLSIQWDNRLLLMVPIWMVGLMVLYRLRRLHISATYAASFIGLSAVRSFQTGHAFLAEVAPITGPMYQLFTLFMVTDPPTTVRGMRPQILVVFLVALMEHVLRLNHVIHAPYYALFTVGPAALLTQRWWSARRSA